MFDRRFDRAGWTRRALALPQPRIELIELPHLSIGAPAQVTVTSISQIRMGNGLEATRRIKAGSQFVRERLVVDEGACTRRPDGLFIELLGIEHPAFNPRDLRAHEGKSVLEVVRAVLRPHRKLSPVSG